MFRSTVSIVHIPRVRLRSLFVAMLALSMIMTENVAAQSARLVTSQAQIEVSRVRNAAQLGSDGKVLSIQLPVLSGGGSGASSLNALVGCVPTVSGAVLTLPTTCVVSTGANSSGVAASAPAAFTWSSGDGIINIGYDNGVYYAWSSTTGTCGTGLVCVPSTPNYPNGALKIAHVTVTGGVLGSVVQDMTISQQKIVIQGQNLGRTWTLGEQIIAGAFLRNPRIVSATSDTLTNADCGNLVVYTSASAISVTLPQAGANGNFLAGCEIQFSVQGSDVVTITPVTSTIRGGTALSVTTSTFRYTVNSDGTNYY
jgi:hypothetical protein